MIGLHPSLEPRALQTATVAVLAVVLLVFLTIASAQEADGAGGTSAPPLVVFATYSPSQSRTALSTHGTATLEDIRSDPAAFGIRIGHGVPEPVLAARSLSLALPSETGAPGTSPKTDIVFTAADIDHHDNGLTSLYAWNEEADAEVALVIQGSDVLGSVRKGDDVYKVHPLGDGLTAVYGYDTSLLRRHPDGWGEFTQKRQEEFLRKWNELMREVAPEPNTPPANDATAPSAAADTGDEIDILVAYTPRARRAAGNIDAFIQFAIDNTHRIYRNSQIPLRLRLVHKYETSYEQHSSMATDLVRLTDIDGHMDEVHDLRNRHGADLVILIVGRNTESACGVAFLPPYGSQINANFASQGFSVIGQNCETSTYHSFAHEIGHNQGADHDPGNALGAAFSYGHGRCNTDRGWHTVMAYPSNERGRCAREIEYFSSPGITYDGRPTGDAKVRDNRRVLFNTAERVANFRRSTTPRTRSHTLSLVTPASESGLQTFVRVINRSNGAGTVRIHAIDDEGGRFGPATLSLEGRQTRHFTSTDLEEGSSEKGLSGGVGDGTGNWRLELVTELNIEPLAYIRTEDGFVTTVHEVAAETRGSSRRYHVPFFNPAKNESQVSRLRLINPGNDSARLTISGVDDRGDSSSGGEVRLTLEPGAARMVSSEQLEQGAAGLSGRFDAGSGKWRLSVSTDRPIQVLSLLHSRNTGNLANLSRGHAGSSIPLVTPASNFALQTFVRVINRSDAAGTVRIHAIDDEGRRFGPATLSMEAGQTSHFNSVDLEKGNASKGLSGGVGDGTGDWRLELSTNLDIEPLAYIRTEDGFVTALHEVAAETQESSRRYHVPFFNPGKNDTQVSRLRLINPGSRSAWVAISGVDDAGYLAPGGDVRLTLGARAARTVSAKQLEEGAAGLTGRFDAGSGKWQLSVSADRPIEVLSLLHSRNTGNLANLSRGQPLATIGPPPPPPPPPPPRENHGAYAYDFFGRGCRNIPWGLVVDRSSREEAVQDALRDCRRGGDYYTCMNNLGLFRQCAALVFGYTDGPIGRRCGISVLTGSDAGELESAGLARCREEEEHCSILSGRQGRALGCNTQGTSPGGASAVTVRAQLRWRE